MSSRKKSTSTEESSSGSTTDSSSSSGSTSGSDSGSSSSESDSSSSPDEKSTNATAGSNNQGTTGGTGNVNSKSNNQNERTTARRKSSSENKQQQQQSKSDEKPPSSSVKVNKNQAVNRGQRLSKSSVYSSDEEVPSKKSNVKAQLSVNDRKKPTTEPKKPTSQPPPPMPPSTGGKAPPSVVKQQQQQNFAKNAANRQNLIKTQSKSQVPSQDKAKKKSIFSPDNSSNSDEDEDKQKPNKPTVVSKPKQPSKPKSRTVPQKKPAPAKKDNSKSTASSASTSSSEASSTSSDSDDSETSDGDSSPPSKRPPTKRMLSKNSSKSDLKSMVVSDSDGEHNKAPAVRKLTRSSSTRKSKHLTGKASDSDSDMDTDKRSVSKSPVKKAPVAGTKSKTKAKRGEMKLTTPLPLATPPIPEEQKCPVEGCDSSGHLGGNLEKHFLPEACPMFHNMSASETKEQANERKVKEDERQKAIQDYDPARKFPTPEQKTYQIKIRESRSKFKPATPITNEKVKTEKQSDTHREPNLNGLVPDYDLQLFREAQAIASEKMENELKDLPVGKGTKYITMGKYQMKVWYQSPYPDDAARLPRMYICEFCLRYQKSEVGMKRHAAKCVWRHPPGDEIYRKGKLQVWQVDGKRHKQYCQHLCLLAKFFLDHKTLYYDVEPFLFYVMTLADSEGCHTVGYFSKEKNSFLNYNVSCILTLPPYQRKGYGRLLIDFSYLLTRVEGKIGSPEKPLSDLGLISYRSYWKDVLLDYLCTRTGTTLSIKDVSQEMAISSYDIVSTLQALGMMKYWKGKHIILKKQDVLEEFAERIKRRGNFPKIDRSCLRWTPFVPPQSSGSS